MEIGYHKDIQSFVKKHRGGKEMVVRIEILKTLWGIFKWLFA